MPTRPDQDHWKDWFRENSARLLLYARQQTRSAEDAEDVLQDAFVRMWKVAHREESLGLPNLPYAFTSIRRCAIDLARRDERRRRREDFSQQDGPREAWFVSDLESAEQATAVEDSLRSLPEKYREVITLKIWGEMTFQAIADLMGISINTVASRYRYGLEAMKNQLARHKQELLP